MRVEDAHPAIVSKQEFQRVNKLLGSRAPEEGPPPARPPAPTCSAAWLRCETCGKAMTAAEAKSGKYTYYVCHSLLKRGKRHMQDPQAQRRKELREAHRR